MAGVETAEMIARSRTVSAAALFEGRADLSAYPHQLLAVSSLRGNSPEQVTIAVAAAEYMRQYGWELVNVAEFGNTGMVYAFLRRRPG
jgi:hypothetical protein